jgi:hypothetical protein
MLCVLVDEEARMKAWKSMAGWALLQCVALGAQAAPDLFYLQNGLDGRGRCLGTRGDTVAMNACVKSPDQQWAVTPGDLPGYDKLRTAGAGEMFCLAAHPDERRNVLAMDTCGKDDNQQWFIERISTVPRRMRLTNRATGRTRCLEAQQTGLKLTPCSRRQAGHLWRSNETPDM